MTDINQLITPRQLLGEWKLSEYNEVLKDNGFEDVTKWKDLTIDQLVGFGFKKGHVRRFVNKVQSMNINIGLETRERNTTIVLFGETGVGKSTLIDSIDAFVNDKTFEQIEYTKNPKTQKGQSQTQECNVTKLVCGQSNNTITVIDTPGIGDMTDVLKDEENIDKIIQCIMDTKYVNVFAFLIKSGTNHATKKLKYVVSQLKFYLPQFANKHFIVILTRSDVE